MNRKEALQLIEELKVSPNILKHLLANEAIMRALGAKFEPDKVEDYALAGLLHDADYEFTQKDPSRHPLVVAEKLKERGVSGEIIDAILGHSNETGVERKTMMAKSLYAGDNMAGLITACALVQPERKLSTVTQKSILDKFKTKNFAAGAKREEIITCESELGIPLPKFAEICLGAMQNIASALGL